MEEKVERTFCNERILREVADELGLKLNQVREIVNIQSEYTKVVIESGSFDNIRWPYLGTFTSKPKELQMLQYLAGLTPEQGSEFKKAVRTGKIKLNSWEDRIKAKRKQKKTNGTEPEL